MKLFMVGQSLPEPAFHGIFSTEAKAVAECKDATFWIVPVILDEPIGPEETHFRKVRFPKHKNSNWHIPQKDNAEQEETIMAENSTSNEKPSATEANSLILTYGKMMDEFRSNPSARGQRVDWLPQVWLFIENHILKMRLADGTFIEYQDYDKYNLSGDLYAEWRPVK